MDETTRGVKPAMTAEEWARAKDESPLFLDGLEVHQGGRDGRGYAQGWCPHCGETVTIPEHTMYDPPKCCGIEWEWPGESVSVAQTDHATAALALHGQDFGFSWDDVDAVREAVEGAEGSGYDDRRLVHLADRIAALLPPRD